MKKLLVSIIAVASLAGTLTLVANPAPRQVRTEMSQSGWQTIRDKVTVYTINGHFKSSTTAGPLQRDDNGSLRINYQGSWYSVYGSDRNGYSYMFVARNSARYFN